MTMPGFINQLLLLMNSGITVQEAFEKIGEGYSGLPEERQNYFTREISALLEASRRNGESASARFGHRSENFRGTTSQERRRRYAD